MKIDHFRTERGIASYRVSEDDGKAAIVVVDLLAKEPHIACGACQSTTCTHCAAIAEKMTGLPSGSLATETPEQFAERQSARTEITRADAAEHDRKLASDPAFQAQVAVDRKRQVRAALIRRGYVQEELRPETRRIELWMRSAIDPAVVVTHTPDESRIFVEVGHNTALLLDQIEAMDQALDLFANPET